MPRVMALDCYLLKPKAADRCMYVVVNRCLQEMTVSFEQIYSLELKYRFLNSENLLSQQNYNCLRTKTNNNSLNNDDNRLIIKYKILDEAFVFSETKTRQRDYVKFPQKRTHFGPNKVTKPMIYCYYLFTSQAPDITGVANTGYNE